MVHRYEIVVEGRVGALAEMAVEGFEVEPHGAGRSRMVGEVVDQAYLQGVLHRLADLQVLIVDVHRLE